ncbi:hypothetical protein [Paenibacillus pedocola]|nr:hypothetical protein [Paenibacillus typhae]
MCYNGSNSDGSFDYLSAAEFPERRVHGAAGPRPGILTVVEGVV